MRVKKGADISKLKEVLKNKLEEIERSCQVKEGKDYEMTITSGNDGIHMKNSKHYVNEAIDIRRNDMKYPRSNQKIIQATLGSDYDIVLETTHIHIEYDKK